MNLSQLYFFFSSKRKPPFPPIPSRDQVCSVQLTFQGLTVNTQQYGTLEWFEAALISLSPSDRQVVYAAKHNAGDTHCIVTLSWNYDESPGYKYPVPGRDLTTDYPTWIALIEEVIQNGFIPLIMLPGDGMSPPGGGYVNQQGWTYGWQWLMNNIPTIINNCKMMSKFGDLTKYCLFCTGWDSCFYGWGDTPNVCVQQFGELFRQILPNGFLAIEHDIGHIPVGSGEDDYSGSGAMTNFDVIMSEFNNWPVTGDPTWQIAGRLIRPYNRPPDQPQGDDPNPPFYLAELSPRGPYYTIAFEWAEYPWTRGGTSPVDINAGRAYYKALGYKFVC